MVQSHYVWSTAEAQEAVRHVSRMEVMRLRWYSTCMNISIVIPIYNEEKGIEEFFRRCVLAIENLSHQFVFVAVNDGSTDGSLVKLQEMKKKISYPLRIINLSRNFGHANALTAGINHAEGDVIIIIDADLEDPPELIPAMIAQHELGKDVVYTVKTRREATIPRRMAFRLFHFLFSKVTNLNIPEGSGSFSLMSRQFATEFSRLHEYNRFLPGLRAYIGFDPGYVSYTKERRFSGLPKQTFSRLLDLSLNAFFLFSTAPIWASTLLLAFGIVTAVSSALLPVDSYFQRNFSELIGVVILLQLWIIAIIVFKSQMQSLQRPSYIVKRIYE